MKNLEAKLIGAFFGLFGAGLAFVVYLFALGGWRYVFTGRATSVLHGPVGLIASLVIGAVLGLVSYSFNDREFGGSWAGRFPDQASAVLFVKRLIVVGTALVSLYFIWQLAKSMR